MTPETEPEIDTRSLVKYMKNIGRSYRKQAMELVSACRLFVQAQEQSYQSDIELREALAAVDKALSCAADAKGKTSKEADEKFQEATELLGDYDRKLKGQNPAENGKWDSTVFKRMEEAKSKDKSSSTMLSKLKVMFHSKTLEEESQEPTKVVKFLLRKSPTDINPTVVHQVLSNRSNLQEILWNFSRFKEEKRLTLKQNPHFYKDLPTSSKSYGSGFQTNPIHDFRDVDSVCVLTDKPGRVYLETSQVTRAFGNTWVPNEAIIFKDVCGKLEGESIVGKSIEDTLNIWYREELPPSPSSLHGYSPMSVTNPHPTATASPTYYVAGDWRELIRRKGDSQLRISTKRPESIDGWILYSPTGSSPSSPGLPSPIQQITAVLSITSIPSSSASSYKTALPIAYSPQPTPDVAEDPLRALTRICGFLTCNISRARKRDQLAITPPLAGLGMFLNAVRVDLARIDELVEGSRRSSGRMKGAIGRRWRVPRAGLDAGADVNAHDEPGLVVNPHQTTHADPLLSPPSQFPTTHSPIPPHDPSSTAHPQRPAILTTTTTSSGTTPNPRKRKGAVLRVPNNNKVSDPDPADADADDPAVRAAALLAALGTARTVSERAALWTRLSGRSTPPEAPALPPNKRASVALIAAPQRDVPVSVVEASRVANRRARFAKFRRMFEQATEQR